VRLKVGSKEGRERRERGRGRAGQGEGRLRKSHSQVRLCCYELERHELVSIRPLAAYR